jgi:hypothetical protein
MGYTTDFEGQFDLDKPLDLETLTFLKKFAQTRRMARNVGPEYGVEGELYIDGSGDFGQGQDANIIDFNRAPSTQPGLWCQWVPTDDGLHIEWDGGEKFYAYAEWLDYIIRNILEPRGYVLNGTVQWQGEESSDVGRIVVRNNLVATQTPTVTWPSD